jgi:hypothetical protein
VVIDQSSHEVVGSMTGWPPQGTRSAGGFPQDTRSAGGPPQGTRSAGGPPQDTGSAGGSSEGTSIPVRDISEHVAEKVKCVLCGRMTDHVIRGAGSFVVCAGNCQQEQRKEPPL